MNVLITKNFNDAMRGLSERAKKEAARLYAVVTEMSEDEFASSPLLTRIKSSDGPIYTLRLGATRVFCTLNEQGNVLFLHVAEIDDVTLEAQAPVRAAETTLFSKSGSPAAYIAADDDQTIYSFSGEPLAYVDDKSNIYGFNGKHLGWYEQEIVWDHQGRRVGFTAGTCPSFVGFEPFKSFKQFKPFKGFKQYPPLKPVKTFNTAQTDLLSFLKQGAR